MTEEETLKTIVVLLVSSVMALGQSALTRIVPLTGIDDRVPDDTVLIDQQGRGYVNARIFNTRWRRPQQASPSRRG